VFEQALTDIIRRLEEAQASGLLQQYALIGGFAVSAWGVPRATHDLDFALALGSAQPSALANHLKAEFHGADSDDPLRGVFRCDVMIEGQAIPTQLILLPPAWTDMVFQGVVSLTVFECAIPVVSWQSLILLKLYAGGPQDLLDAKDILAVRQPTTGELKEVAKSAERVGLSETFHSLTYH